MASHTLALRNKNNNSFDVRSFDPTEGPRVQKKMAVALIGTTGLAGGLVMAKIIGAVSISLTSVLATCGIALVVIAALAAVYYGYKHYKGASEDQNAMTLIQNKAIQQIPTKTNKVNESEEGAPSKPWFGGMFSSTNDDPFA
jgi:hypothetical protein